MTHSLNEVEAMARKAARGAGYSWGMAEEAGIATRWLCAQGLDGCGALALLLETDKATCPLTAGVTLIDDPADPGQERTLETLAAPMLLLPFVAQLAQRLSTSLTLNWPGGTVTTDGTTTSLIGIFPASAAPTLRRGAHPTHALPHVTRAEPDATVWQTLTAYAARTYAPDSDTSRLTGAGAGLTDND